MVECCLPAELVDGVCLVTERTTSPTPRRRGRGEKKKKGKLWPVQRNTVTAPTGKGGNKLENDNKD